MNSLQRHAGAIQFFLLALLYGLAWFYSDSMSRDIRGHISSIVIIEFPVLVYGWFITFLFYLPMILADKDSAWLRRGLLLIVSLFALTGASYFTREYGYYGMLVFFWLLFINYGSIFLANVEFIERKIIAGEIAARTIFFLIIFLALSRILDMPNSVGSPWFGKEKTLLFGLLYFSFSAFIEYKRYFQWAATLGSHLLTNRYVRVPNSKVRYRDGKLRAHPIKRNNFQHWWFFALTGMFLIAFTSYVLYGISQNKELEWWALVFIGLFILLFFVIGIIIFGSSLVMAYKVFSAEPAWLGIQDYEWQHGDKLYADGFVPLYDEKFKRETVDVELICYRVTPPADEYDVAKVNMPAARNITDRATMQHDGSGTRFNVECEIPDIDRQEHAGAYYVWHLQVNVRDSSKHQQPEGAMWRLAFTLPPPEQGSERELIL
jgi:hypothetical protein